MLYGEPNIIKENTMGHMINDAAKSNNPTDEIVYQIVLIISEIGGPASHNPSS